MIDKKDNPSFSNVSDRGSFTSGFYDRRGYYIYISASTYKAEVRIDGDRVMSKNLSSTDDHKKVFDSLVARYNSN